MTEVAIVVPVLGRPHRVAPLLENIRETTTGARVVFVADPYDWPEQAAIRDAGGEALLVDGGYARKINAGCRVTAEPFVFAGADDLVFHEGWFDLARAAMTGGVQVVGVNDLMRRRRGEHATHFLMSREYVRRACIDGTAGPMCEHYDHSFVDDELIATARARDVYAYARDAVVEHRHWLNRKVDDDETYRKGRVRFDQDRALFRERTSLWT